MPHEYYKKNKFKFKNCTIFGPLLHQSSSKKLLRYAENLSQFFLACAKRRKLMEPLFFFVERLRQLLKNAYII